ncbi:MAG TPA: 5'-nucleotidase, partial [Fimbriimonadaceae bacterium]|nr:5'-nucleotidase [Fimbriimonadaceae bacterium]
AAASLCAWAQQRGPAVDSHAPSQAAADILRDVANADGAFLAAGLVKESFQSDDLSTLMQYPDDEIVVIGITGAQIRQAFERSISLFPQPNTSMLQISGFEVVFDPNAEPSKRIKRISAGGSALDEGKTYNVAMPSSLGRGGLGYFKIWDKTKIVSTVAGTTVEKALAGKKLVQTSARWVAER